MEYNFDGLNSSGVATGKNLKMIGQKTLKERLTTEFSDNKVSERNSDPIVVNVFGDWGLGKTHLAYKLFNEINNLVLENELEIVSKKFADNSICALLNYKYIDTFQLSFLPRNISLAASYWFDEDAYSISVGNKNQICFNPQREKILDELNLENLKNYNSLYSNYKNSDFDSFEALKKFLDENNKKRLIIIIDEIEELEHKSNTFVRIDISKLYERLTTFVSNAPDSISEKYRIGFIFLISEEMYDRVKEYVEITETSSARRFINIHLKRYSEEEMFNFLRERLLDNEWEFVKTYKEYFRAIWEACNRNFGWFEVAAKNLCLELSKEDKNDLQTIEEALKKTKKNRFSVFNHLYYKSLLEQNAGNETLIERFCLKPFPQKFEEDRLIEEIVYCGETSLKTDENGDIIDPKFNERLKENKSRLADIISFENSIGNLPIESITDSLYKFDNLRENYYLTYYPIKDFQFHLTWAANRKLDRTFTEKLKDCLNLQKRDDYSIVSTDVRKDIYQYYKPNLSADWINPKKLRIIKKFLNS